MKIYITQPGDPGVGIWEMTAVVELPCKNVEDVLIWRDVDRQTFRKEIQQFFAENIFGDKCKVLFELECADCGAERREDCLSCPNENCPTNMGYDDEYRN